MCLLMDSQNGRPSFEIHIVSSIDSPEFSQLTHTLTRSHLIALDAEWKPLRTPDQHSSFPRVSLLQIACQFHSDHRNDSVVFLLDLLSLPLSSIWDLLRDVFVSPHVLKLGFRFKQDLVYLSTTFCSYGGGGLSGLDRIEPFMDITSIYNHLQHKQNGRKLHKQTKSLAAICSEILGLSLSKELQCSDWSFRPLTEEQIAYAAMDAHCLLEIFNVFYSKVVKEGDVLRNVSAVPSTEMNIGLKVILEKQDVHEKILMPRVSEALNIIRATASDFPQSMANIRGNCSASASINCMHMDKDLQKIVKSYGEKIILKESDKKPRTSKRKGKRSSTMKVVCSEKQIVCVEDWQGPPPWDLSFGGDGFPKFLCDVMVEGLAKHLRCVGIDAAVPFSKKPDSRELIDQACKEKRVLLTRDAKLLRHEYLLCNQIYRVKSLLKNEQLLEVIETFNLKISEDQLMSRCTKCNGRFIQKSLTTEEAVQAAKGFQKIPNCLFDRNLEFWQCMDCHQLYWEGIQYRNAIQKFIDVCKLND